MKRKDVELAKSGTGHVVSEVYIKALNNWVYADPQWNKVPRLDGVPLNAIELKDALYYRKEVELDSLVKTRKQSIYPLWIAEYLYFIDMKLDQRYDNGGKQRIMLVPKGVSAPKVFQRKYPIDNMIFTNSVATVYHPL